MSYVQTIEPRTAAEVMEAARRVEARRRVMRQPVKAAPSIQDPEPFLVVEHVFLERHDAHILAYREYERQMLIDRVVNAKKQIDDLMEAVAERRPLIRQFIKQLCDHFGVEWSEIIGPSRFREIVLPRQKMQWLVMKFYNDRMSYPLVGRIFKRDHTTILHACRKIDRLLAANDPSVADVRDILEMNGVKA